MVTIKKTLEYAACVLLVGLLGLVSGCKPAGVKALYKGEKLIRDGEFARAVAVLEEAGSLLPTNALAFNFLGLAYHRNGQAREAHAAYTRALSLDRELAAARYNLGCLYLEQNNPEAAVGELTGYTMRAPRSVPGWLKLGNAHLEMTDSMAVANAYKAFQTVLEIEPDHPEAFNGLGLMEVKRKRPKDALFYFNKALEGRPDFPAVQLNIAIVADKELNDKALALEAYKKYLGMEPRPANWDAVAAAARNLELELEAAAAVSVAVDATGQVIFPEPQITNVVFPPATAMAETNPVAPAPEAAALAVRALEVVDPIQPEPVAAAEGEAGLETVVLPVEPVMAPVETAEAALPPDPVRSRESETPTRARLSSVTPETRKAVGFRQRLQSRGATEVQVASAVVAEPEPLVRAPESRRVTPDPEPELEPRPQPARPAPRQDSGRRYIYLSPPAAPAGNREVAERFFRAGLNEQKAGRLPAAVAEYRRATQADPAYYEAFYNQGLAALALRDWKQSLAAYEYALAQNPSSADARYNFALALQQGMYIQDAANELSRLIQSHPGDIRAHLSLANVQAKLGQTEAARSHYQQVLALDPNHPQSRSIRAWLAGAR